MVFSALTVVMGWQYWFLSDVGRRCRTLIRSIPVSSWFLCDAVDERVDGGGSTVEGDASRTKVPQRAPGTRIPHKLSLISNCPGTAKGYW